MKEEKVLKGRKNSEEESLSLVKFKVDKENYLVGRSS